VDDKEFFAHFPSQISQAIKDYARDVAFKWSRYIFTHRVGKKQYGYCTYCRKEFKTNGLRHGQQTTCPECGSLCTVKASGRGRKTLVDEVYFVYYEKSVVNPQAIVARGIYAVRDYRFDYRKVETQYTTRGMYVFEPGNGGRMARRYAWYAQHGEFITCGCLQQPKTVFSLFNNGTPMRVQVSYSRESIKTAVKDTPFAWSGWESYDHEDMTRFFDLYAKYPCIEYLTKLGFKSLVMDKLEGRRTFGAINWRGKTLFEVLKMTKQELNIIKAEGIGITFDVLKIMQMSRKDGSNFTPGEAADIALEYSYHYLDELTKLLTYGSMRKITSYLAKQSKKEKKHFRSPTDALMAWRDYIADCKKLEMDLSRTSVLFPRNLYTAHQNTIRQVKIKADNTLNKKIKARLETLSMKYCFEYSGLMIRPAKDSIEMLDEGRALDHCVGTYAQGYARGDFDILFIRKTTEPNKPYYTVEVRQGKVIQCRGINNCQPTKEVEEFIEVFKAEKLRPKKAKTKIRVPA